MNFLRLSGSWFFETCSARDRGAADDEEVDAGGDDGLVELLRALRRERAGDGDAGGADLGEAGRDELGLDRLGVELLHARGRLLGASSVAISASSGSGSSYRVQRPSRSSTPRPPSWPSMIAVAGLHHGVHRAPRGPGCRTGTRRSTSRPRRPRGRACAATGTMAMSSNAYARRPRLARPISISLLTRQAYRRAGGRRHAGILPGCVSTRCDPDCGCWESRRGDRWRDGVRRMSWTDGPLLGFDTETTGIDVDNDRIVTAALVRRDETGTHIRSWLINPGIDIPEAASAIHGVSSNMRARTARQPKQALEEIASELAQAFRDGVPVVAYNATFDLCLLDAELRRHKLKTLPDRPVQRGAAGDRPARARPGRGPVPARQAQAGRPVRVLRGRRVRRPAHGGRRRGGDAGRAGAHRRALPAPGRRSTWTRCTSTSRRRTRRGPRASTPGVWSRGSTGLGRRTSGPHGSRSAPSGETRVISPAEFWAIRSRQLLTWFDGYIRDGNISSMS